MIRAGIPEGEVYAATDDTEDVLGFAMAMPKGEVLFSTYVMRLLFLCRKRLC